MVLVYNFQHLRFSLILIECASFELAVEKKEYVRAQFRSSQSLRRFELHFGFLHFQEREKFWDPRANYVYIGMGTRKVVRIVLQLLI